MTAAWIEQIFNASQARYQGVVRRSVQSVERYSSVADLVAAARARGFHVIETGDQLVVLCHPGELVIHC